MSTDKNSPDPRFKKAAAKLDDMLLDSIRSKSTEADPRTCKHGVNLELVDCRVCGQSSEAGVGKYGTRPTAETLSELEAIIHRLWCRAALHGNLTGRTVDYEETEAVRAVLAWVERTEHIKEEK